MINQKDAHKNWICGLRLNDPNEVKKLMSKEQYDEYLKSIKH